MTDYDAGGGAGFVSGHNADLVALIDALEQYVTFLEKAMDSPVGVAHFHGWVCPKADVEAGRQHRERISALRIQSGGQEDEA